MLLVEDEEAIGSIVRTYLGRDGYRVVWVRTGEKASPSSRRHPIRLVVLDIGLPGLDGFEVCRRLARSPQPILMLTARDEEPDRVAGSRSAPTTTCRSRSRRASLARVKAILRRSEPLAARQPHRARRRRRRRRGPRGDGRRRVGRADGEGVRPPRASSRAPASCTARPAPRSRVGMSYPGGTRTVDVHVGQLRRKLGRPTLIRPSAGPGTRPSRRERAAVPAAPQASLRDRRHRRGLDRRDVRHRRRAVAASRNGPTSTTSRTRPTSSRSGRASRRAASLLTARAAAAVPREQNQQIKIVDLDEPSAYLEGEHLADVRARRPARARPPSTARRSSSPPATSRGAAACSASEDASFADWQPFLLALLIAGAIAAGLAAIGSFLTARAIARPVRRVAEASRSLAEGVSPDPVPVEGSAELALLATSFNEMASFAEAHGEAERNFLLSVSHELKTPLTAIRGYAEALEDGAVLPRRRPRHSRGGRRPSGSCATCSTSRA